MRTADAKIDPPPPSPARISHRLRALDQLAEALASGRAPFTHAAQLLAQTQGRVIVTGMGKSGHIARKIAATMASWHAGNLSTRRRPATAISA